MPKISGLGLHGGELRLLDRAVLGEIERTWFLQILRAFLSRLCWRLKLLLKDFRDPGIKKDLTKIGPYGIPTLRRY